MNRLNISPPVGYYAPLSDYIDYLKQCIPNREIIRDVFDRLTEISSRCGLYAIVIQEVYPETMIDPLSRLNPWFIRMKKATVYSFDLSQTEGVVENHGTHFTFSSA